VPYDNLISRADVDGLIPQDVADRVISAMGAASIALGFFQRIPISRQTNLPFTAGTPVAYWVSGDTGLKPTTEVNWDSIALVPEEIAAIVPVPDAVLSDASVDLWGQVQPQLAAAAAITLDAAACFGVNKPGSWPAAIVPAAQAAGNAVEAGAHPAAEGGIAQDLSDVFAKVEAAGFAVDRVVANPLLRAQLRSARASDGQALVDVSTSTLFGVPISFVATAWPADVLAIAGAFSYAVIGIRQALAFKLLDQAVIIDDTGKIIYNLPQQDMTAMRLTARYAYGTVVPPSIALPGVTNRFPFAVLTAATTP
jgi:HK97 family phage major capsid protein